MSIETPLGKTRRQLESWVEGITASHLKELMPDASFKEDKEFYSVHGFEVGFRVVPESLEDPEKFVKIFLHPSAKALSKKIGTLDTKRFTVSCMVYPSGAMFIRCYGQDLQGVTEV